MNQKQTKYSIFLILILGIMFALPLQAQEKWVKKGDALFEAQEYTRAAEMYEWAIRKNETSQTQAKLGDCYRKLNQYENALRWYQKATEKGYQQPDFIIHYGQTLLATDQLDAARELVAMARQTQLRNPQLLNFESALNDREFLMADSSRYQLEKVSFSGPWSDFSPAFFQDGLVFCAARKKSSTVVYASVQENAPLVDLYFSKSKEEGEWSRPVLLKGEVNSPRNDGPACFTRDQSRMYFTRDETIDPTQLSRENPLSKLKIFEATLEEGQWKNIQALPFNDDAYAIGHPALSPDETTLYFTSDMPGGFGGTDLYRVTRKGENWGDPENLGEDINTAGNEMFPFVHRDGTLYFASDGHIGLGNLDLYSAVPKGKYWTRIKNLGFPINSANDDFGLTLDSAKTTGYLSSNRGGDPSNDDIYAFQILLPKFECTAQEENVHCYRFYDRAILTEAQLDTLPLVYEWDLGDGNKARGLEVEHCFEKAGYYEVKLNVVDTSNGFVFYNGATYDLFVEDIRQVYIEGPEFVETGVDFTFDGKKSNPEGCTVERYFWDFGDGFMEGESNVSHRWSQAGPATLRLGVLGTHPETGEECTACSTIEIEVLAHAQYEDSLALLQADADRQNREKIQFLQGKKPDLLGDISQKKFALRDYEDVIFRVQLVISPVQIPLDSAAFKGMEGVEEFYQDPNYVYTVGEAEDPRLLYRLYTKAVELEFEAAMVIGMVEDKVMTGNDSTFWIQIPHHDQPDRLSVVRGKLLDLNGVPVMADIYFDDLVQGKVYAVTTSDSTGDYYVELPNGRLYGFHAEADGFFPISDYVDLRDINTRMEYIGKIRMVSDESITEVSIRINNIFFETGSYQLKKESTRELDRLLRYLIEHPDQSAVIEGHTDSVGDDIYNEELSLNRAKAVLRYLVLQGYNVDQLKAKGFGEAKPVASNDTEEGRAMNRRVEFRFVRK